VIHLNNAGSSLQPRPVAAAVRSYLDDEVNLGGYETADARRAEINDFYDATADLINARSDEIAFLDSATRAWQMIFYSLDLGEGDEIITTTTEYHSNYVAYLHLAARRGVKAVVMPDAPSGEIDVEALANSINSHTRLISLNHIPTNGGLVNPAAEVGAVARAAGVPFLLDACQSVGQVPIDVELIGCDFLTATGRKYLRGPRGTGFLYVTRRRLADIDPIVIDGHAAPWATRGGYELQPDGRRFEVWEQHLAGKVGLAVAARYAKRVGPAESWQRIQDLGAGLRQRLGGLPGVTVHDRGAVQGGIVTFAVDGMACSDLSATLRRFGINTSAPRVATARIDMETRGLSGLVRASVHYFNTEEELDTLTAAIGRLAG
jgi:selenocysteine lyase/cysteine desulfurase